MVRYWAQTLICSDDLLLNGGWLMRTKKSMLTAWLNCKVSANIREAVEEYVIRENLSLGEATRHFLAIGIQKSNGDALKTVNLGA